jgi:amino acid transporter
VPAIDSDMAPIIAQLVGLEGTPSQISLIIIFVLIIQAIINIVGVKLAAMINNAAVFTESIGIIALTIILFVMGIKNEANPSVLFDTAGTAGSGSYLGPIMLCMLMGAFTLVGFESAANLSEETLDPGKTVPKAIIGSVGISGIFGMQFLMATTFSIKDYAGTINSSSPISHIITGNLGPVVGTAFLVDVCISIFACGTVSMTPGSKLVYAMSRDDAFFASKTFKKISPKTSTPIYATLLILAFAIIGTLASGSLTTLIGVTSVLPGLIYLITIVCYGINRKKIVFQKGHFNLGAAAKPIFVTAILWLIVELCILTIPEQFNAIAYVSIAVIAVGVALYWGIFKKRIAHVEDFGADIQEIIVEP